jgi:pimeloyl-ACP methyl ester carboxylesterase
VIDERALISELSRSSPDQLLARIAMADRDEQRVYQIYFGPEQYASLQRLAMRSAALRGAPSKGNVVVLHGIMGGELTLFNTDGQSRIWVDILHLMAGQFDRLSLDDVSGLSLRDVRPSGIYMKFYATQIASLSQDWTVRPFFYDWRRDVRQAADDLARNIDSWFGPAAPVHLVAHSMGGLVARSFLQRHPERWKSMADEKLEKGGRLVMLGTPNYGSFAIPRLLFGRNDVLDVLVKINLAHLLDRSFFINIIRTFTGAYQMLPVRAKLAGLDPLYRSTTYAAAQVRQEHLDSAEDFQREIAGAIDRARMVYVAGYNRLTFSGITNPGALALDSGYTVTMRGDGTVPHVLGQIDGVKTYYVDEEHSKLPGNDRVCRAMTELLQTGSQRDETNLYFGLAANIRGLEQEDQAALLAAEAERRRIREDKASVLASRLQSRGAVDGAAVISPEEQALADLLMTHEADGRGPGAPPEGSPPSAAEGIPTASVFPVSLRVALRVAKIEDITPGSGGKLPIDALAVGHYLGVRPSGAEWKLDAAISPYWAVASPPCSNVLVQFHERGIFRGTLGQPFFLPDPRPGHEGVLLAIMGMGQIGGFGIPELAVVVRELTYSLAQLGKAHLATVLIGSSRDNLTIPDALHAFLVGVQRTLIEAAQGNTPRLEQITLVARRPDAAVEIARALSTEAECWRGRGFTIDVDVPQELAPSLESDRADARDVEPVRIALEIEGPSLRIAAFTKSASVPERDVRLNSIRLLDLSRQLIDETDPKRRLQLGQYLLMYLFPQDIRGGLTGNLPIVLSCNNAAAQIPWELAALRPESAIGAAGDQPYLGLLRGVTRQLRTTMAPPPEPPPPAARNLRVLLVADTCREHPLPGAQREADTLMGLFRKINQANVSRGRKEFIQCTSLTGPANATLLNALLEINTSDPYDVMHYAGHCFYDREHPEKSGYLFSDGDCLTADDLQRVDHVPKFIFSNACESGVLPSRADQASSAMAATFAEAFFGRGVANFVCTAWPIEDDDACRFAVTLYSGLLGLDDSPDMMWLAMRTARQSIVGEQTARHTWGAYQHYGNPYFRLFR